MYFEIVGDITHIETIAIGTSIREIARLRKLHGRGRWRKRKGIARVRLEDGAILLAVGGLVGLWAVHHLFRARFVA